jgi:glycogen phosphorylase
VSLGHLSGDDVQVQLIHGVAGQGGELSQPAVVSMDVAGPEDDGHLRYRGAFTCETAGRYGVTVRIVPSNPDLTSTAEVGRIAWA